MMPAVPTARVALAVAAGVLALLATSPTARAQEIEPRAYSNIPVGEIYTLSADMEDPYNIYAGLQDHEHWKGPSEGALG